MGREISVGERFGRLIITGLAIKVNGKKKIPVVCDCGVTKFAGVSELLTRQTVSCGCYNREKPMPTRTTHGLRRHPIYVRWKLIKARCLNPNNPAYKNYGGRGVTICEEWKNNPLAFYNWCIKNGWDNGLEIDRTDNSRGYSPDNCRFVHPIINSRNRRTTLRYEYNGVTKTLYEWAQDFNIDYKTLHARVRVSGMSFKQAVEYKRKGAA